MTERTLNRAVSLDKQIDMLQEKKKNLERAQKLCWGDTAEVQKRTFKIRITEPGITFTDDVAISSDSVKIALDQEIKEVEETLAALRKEFSEL